MLAASATVVELSFMPREHAIERTLNTLRFFDQAPHCPQPNATEYNGFYYHFLDMKTGARASCDAPAFQGLAGKRSEGNAMKCKLIGSGAEQRYVLVFGTGDEVTEQLTQFAADNHLTASNFTAIGAFSDARLGFFDLQKKDYEPIVIDARSQKRSGNWSCTVRYRYVKNAQRAEPSRCAR